MILRIPAKLLVLNDDPLGMVPALLQQDVIRRSPQSSHLLPESLGAREDILKRLQEGAQEVRLIEQSCDVTIQVVPEPVPARGHRAGMANDDNSPRRDAFKNRFDG